MATPDSTTTQTPSPGAAKPAPKRRAATGARKAPAKSARATTRKPAARRSTARTRSTAAPKPAAPRRNIAERAALVYVGATLEARDRVLGAATGLADRFGSREAAEKELRTDLRRFERRGSTARNRLERDVRKARRRVERELRSRRRDLEREMHARRRDLERELRARRTSAERILRRPDSTATRERGETRNILGERLVSVSTGVENAVQAGFASGERIASVARRRVGASA